MIRKNKGRPRHNLSLYVIILKKVSPEDKDRQCICKACNEILKEKAKPIINRKERIKKHLSNCEYFWNKYGEEANEILNNCISDEETDKLSINKRIHLDGKY